MLPPKEFSKAAQYKSLGNEAHQKGNYRESVYFFTMALECGVGPSLDHVLFSNRSASYCLMEDFERALADAEMVIAMKPDWSKGYSRKAAALHGLKRYADASTTYKTGLELEPENDTLKKGLADSEGALALLAPKAWTNELQQETRELLAQTASLVQLKSVVWHLEIFKEKVWLMDQPFPPFRPRTLLLFTHTELLNMTAHPARESITLDELMHFILHTCLGIRAVPSTIEFSDRRLQSVLEKQLDSLNIATSTSELQGETKQFVLNTVHSFEEKERLERWKDNPAFSGVLRQRQQPGLMTVDGVTPFFLKYLFGASALFYRSRAYLYFNRALGVAQETNQGGNLSRENFKVAVLTRNAMGQFGIAKADSLADTTDSPQCGRQSLMFADVTVLPFDDVDMAERYGWDIAEDQYPLPLLHENDIVMHRPCLKDLQWYEIALRSIALFITRTFAMPNFPPTNEPSLCCRCVVQTHAGPVTTIITVPPCDSAEMQPMQTFFEPLLPPPREQPLHLAIPDSARGLGPRHNLGQTVARPLPLGDSSPPLAPCVPEKQNAPISISPTPANTPVKRAVDDHGRSANADPCIGIDEKPASTASDNCAIPLSFLDDAPSEQSPLPQQVANEDRISHLEDAMAQLKTELQAAKSQLVQQATEMLEQKRMVDRILAKLEELGISKEKLLGENRSDLSSETGLSVNASSSSFGSGTAGVAAVLRSSGGERTPTLMPASSPQIESIEAVAGSATTEDVVRIERTASQSLNPAKPSASLPVTSKKDLGRPTPAPQKPAAKQASLPPRPGHTSCHHTPAYLKATASFSAKAGRRQTYYPIFSQGSKASSDGRPSPVNSRSSTPSLLSMIPIAGLNDDVGVGHTVQVPSVATSGNLTSTSHTTTAGMASSSISSSSCPPLSCNGGATAIIESKPTSSSLADGMTTLSSFGTPTPATSTAGGYRGVRNLSAAPVLTTSCQVVPPSSMSLPSSPTFGTVLSESHKTSFETATKPNALGGSPPHKMDPSQRPPQHPSPPHPSVGSLKKHVTVVSPARPRAKSSGGYSGVHQPNSVAPRARSVNLEMATVDQGKPFLPMNVFF